MRKLTLLLDMDGIISNTYTRWYAEYNEKYGDDLCMERVLSWDTHLYARHGKKVYSVLSENGFFQRPDPLPGAIEGVRELQDDGHRIILLTAGSGHALSDKYFWVQKHLPFLDTRLALMCAYAKDIVKGDILFDDGPHNIVDYREAWPDSRIATIAYPYNKIEQCLCDFVAGLYTNPVACWERFVSWVRDVAKQEERHDSVAA